VSWYGCSPEPARRGWCSSPSLTGCHSTATSPRHGLWRFHTGSLYFTITVLSTTGFGDITPVSDTARLIVSTQMLTDLILVALVVKTIVSAARLGMQRRYGTDDAIGSTRIDGSAGSAGVEPAD